MGLASLKVEAKHGLMKEFNRHDKDATHYQSSRPCIPNGPPWSEVRFRSTLDTTTGETLEDFADVRQMPDPFRDLDKARDLHTRFYYKVIEAPDAPSSSSTSKVVAV